MVKLIRCFVILGLLVAAGMAYADEAKPPEYLTPTHFNERGNISEFLPYAQKFFAENPRDSRTSQVLLDCWMVATIINDKTVENQAQFHLLLDHPQSVQAAFLLRSRKHEEIRKIITTRFEDLKHPLNRVTMFKIARLIQGINKAYGVARDDKFNTQFAIATLNPIDAQELRTLVGDSNKDYVRILDIACDKKLSSIDKATALYPIDNPTAKAYLSFILREDIPDHERNSPKLKTLRAQILLDDCKFAEALLAIKELRKDSTDARLLYWQAMAEGATGDYDAACRSLTELCKTQPKSEWVASANRLKAALSKANESTTAYAGICDKAIIRLATSKIDQIEMTVQWQPENGMPLSVYLGLDIPKDSCELIASRSSKPLLAYRAGPDGSKVYMHDAKAIHCYDDEGLCPLIDLKIASLASLGPQDHFNWNLNWQMVKQGQFSLQKSLQNIMALSELQDFKNPEAIFRNGMKRCYFPEVMETENGEIILRWIHPQSNTPELALTEFRLSEDHRLRSCKLGKSCTVTNIFYGGVPSEPNTKPLWPELSEEHKEKMAEGEMLRYMSSALALFAEAYEKEEQVAGREKQTK